MKIVGFVNQKGGVGKSFTAKVVANALAGNQYKKRVLLIDCDEQATSVAMRRRDFASMQEIKKDDCYPLATCLPADLPVVISGSKPLQIITESGIIHEDFDENNYDYAIVDMPGRGQSRDISGLLASLDYAIVVVKGDDSETLSTIDFLQTIAHTQELRKKHDIEPLALALMYNEFENTSTYQNTVLFWEKQKPEYGIYKDVLYLSKKETYRKFNNTYSNMLYELKQNKGLEGLHREFSSFITKLLTFLEQ